MISGRASPKSTPTARGSRPRRSERRADDLPASNTGPTATYGHELPIPDAKLLDNLGVSEIITQSCSRAWSPGPTYHYRVVADKPTGRRPATDHAFTTFLTNPTEPDTCPNAQVRQQTGASLLLDCRAYELVSAANRAAMTCSRTWSPARSPCRPSPRAADGSSTRSTSARSRAPANRPTTGSTHTSRPGARTDGRRPTSASPPTARRRPCRSARRSERLEAVLDTFAFGGPDDLRSLLRRRLDRHAGAPCRRRPGPGHGGLDWTRALGRTGRVRRQGALRRRHALIFGSTSKFEADGNSNGDVSIYDRNLVDRRDPRRLQARTCRPGRDA